MRIVLNTRVDDAASRLAIHGLGARLRAAGIDAVVGDWNDYGSYDVAVFMGYDDDIESARRAHPGIRIALADPKLSQARWVEAARAADFLMVSSVEQRDAFLRVNRNVLVYYMFPQVEARPKRHTDAEPLVIGYHGNRVHLEAMAFTARPAIEELGRSRPIEFHAIYNVAELGKARMGIPAVDEVPVRHVQWTDSYLDALSAADVGIVPNELPVRDRLAALEQTSYPAPELMYQPFDYLVRFKVSSNPGRLYPYARLGIPVVVDFTPSLSQFVLDGVSGFVVSSAYGWFEALETLAASADRRQELAAELRRRLDAEYERQVPQFLDWCARKLKPPPVAVGDGVSPEQELARLGGSAVGRLFRRIRGR